MQSNSDCRDRSRDPQYSCSINRDFLLTRCQLAKFVCSTVGCRPQRAFFFQEIKTCQQSSIGPNFVFFGGQKYGYRPIPSTIDVDEFDLIVRTLRDTERDDTVLHEWYEY